jgi:hypothetical protein
MASDVRRNFQSQTTPVTAPSPRIDDAMLSLNDALDDLGKLRIRTDACKVDMTLSREEIGASIDVFAHILQNMIIPDLNAIPIDLELLRVIPDIEQSPYIKIDPGMYVMYYNALYYGLHQIRGPGDAVAQGMYLKVLEAVPAWLDTPGDKEIDGYTAALMTWTAINNHDYKLSWKFYCKACHYIKIRKFDQLDVIPARDFGEEEKRDEQRYLYWHILSTDTIFRLFHGKPTVVCQRPGLHRRISYTALFFLTRHILSCWNWKSRFVSKLTYTQIRWVPHKVRPPSLLRSNNMHPSMSQITLSVVWIRYTLLTAEMINQIDSCTNVEQDGVIQQKVDSFCTQLEDLLAEWKLESSLTDHTTTDVLRYLIADHVMAIYAIIIGIRRLVRPAGNQHFIDATTLRAARKVAQYTHDFTIAPVPQNLGQSVCIQYIY